MQQEMLNENVVKATVKALQANGLAKLGYTYVNLDDGCVPAGQHTLERSRMRAGSDLCAGCFQLGCWSLSQRVRVC